MRMPIGSRARIIQPARNASTMNSTAGVKPNRSGVFISDTKLMGKAMVVALVSETARPRAQIQAASVTISGSSPSQPTITPLKRIDADAGGEAG